MTTRRLLPALLLVAAAACGDDGNNKPDAAPPRPDAAIDGQTVTCAATAASITSYPGMYAGTVVGGMSNHSVAMGICTVETGGQFYPPIGEEVIVKLEGLTVGKTYVVSLTTAEDLSYYVTNDCPPTSGDITNCQVFTDETLGDETGTFIATGTTHHVIVDTAADPAPPTTGTFTLNVVESECTEATQATDCAPATPVCVNNSCVQCAGSFDCTADTAPVCTANACVAGPVACTGDDINDTTAPGDDGPAGATVIAPPGAATPTTVTAAACNTPDANAEQDWYKVTLPAGDIGIEVNFTGAANDIDVYLLDSTGGVVVAGESLAGISEAVRTEGLTAGDYFIMVRLYDPAATVAAVPYTLKVQRAVCTDNFQCLTGAAPVCGGSGTCGPGPNLCVGDDVGDTASGGDDGPGGARPLQGAIGTPVTLAGSICNSPGSEVDYYKVNANTNGQGITVSLAWTGTDDLDPTVYDSTGRVLGLSFWLNPEGVAVTYLPTGDYYIGVTKFAAAASTAVTAYSITATRTAAQVCTTNVQCASTFKTQLYRGNCDTVGGGVCKFIPAGAGAAGAACDSADDCTSGLCSYISFDADAQDSVCTANCTTTADCAAVGTGLTCTAGLGANNRCVPSCTTNLECGANTGSSTLDTGEPWDYLTCTPADGVCTL